tara:strand:- start:352 stop:1002 length:651 start_codon:yes stop_codon:yes gene_type:complete
MRSPSIPLLEYLRVNSLRETEVQSQLREETNLLPEAGWEVAPEQAQFLALLIKLSNAKQVLEIGTFTGHSTLAMAMALTNGGHLTTCDMIDDYTEIAQRHWKKAGVEDKITLLMGPAVNSLENLAKQVKKNLFDFVFIDANKKDYDTYYEYAIKLTKKGGLIALDNMFWDGRVLDQNDNQKSTTALRQLLKKLHRDDRIDFSLLPIDDGLALAVKK